ncbi:MAG: hypothetical protein JOY63_14690, partial [Acetobacteraceae bacterium]|nr:hypothetical protein [Acetobacteraceae bacterium]
MVTKARLAAYTAGAGALSALFVGKSRLDLSRAKHRSLAGHARLARRLASLIPFYDYGEDRFFSSDDAPEAVAARRREGFRRLSALYKARFARARALTDEVRSALSDLQLTSAYRVPFQYSRIVREHLPLGSFLESSSGVTVADPDGNVFF